MEGTDVKGFVTMGDYQCGLEGRLAAMPVASREIESVGLNASASVRPFLSYFEFERVLGVLIKERLKGRDTLGMLPPRKFWSRDGRKGRDPRIVNGEKRKRTPEDIRRESIRRRVLKCLKDGTLSQQTWGAKLLAFVAELQRKIAAGEIWFTAPKMLKIAKGTAKNGKREYRTVANFEELADRVVLKLATDYLRDRLELVLDESCYSFRRDSHIDHESAVGKLQLWREEHAGETMFIAECDIRKFFDSIPHETVRRRWNEAAKRVGLEREARFVVDAYLNVYSHDGECMCGLPQGGSLSTVLANLVLAKADDVVTMYSPSDARGAAGVRALPNEEDKDLFYARYCDDVIFAHTDEAKCCEAMARYERALGELGLPMHARMDFVYRTERGRTDAEYYEIKTKGPFRWAEPESGEGNVAPWVSFVGSQIRYDGATRIRQESMVRHIRALGRETAAAVREIESGRFWQAKGPAGKQANAEAFAWFSRFRNRLIRKGVGYVTAKLRDCDMCWAAAFGKVTKCAETQREMSRLDRVRENMLHKVAFLLRERGVEVIRGHRFKGHPFSYHAFLMELVNRPTNLRHRSHRLHYSEL